METRKAAVLPCIGTIAFSIAVMLLMLQLQPELIARAEAGSPLPSFGALLSGVQEGAPICYLFWFLGDLTEGPFLKNVAASVCMLAAALLAWRLEKAGSKFAGTGVGGQRDTFLWILAAEFLGVALNIVIWKNLFAVAGWIPTFVPMCAVAPPLVLAYKNGLKTTLTAAVLSALIPFPLVYGLSVYVTAPLALPAFCAVALGMGTGTALALELCRVLPWMEPAAPAAPTQAAEPPAPTPVPRLFFVRLFADGNELIFWGSSLAGIGMYVGALVSWVVNPLHGNYGSGTLPVMICVQFCTTALSLFFWMPKYREDGFAFTFASIIFTSAIVNTYPPSWTVLIPTVVVGASASPFIVDWALKHIPVLRRWHVVVAVQLPIALACAAWSIVVRFALLPLAA